MKNPQKKSREQFENSNDISMILIHLVDGVFIHKLMSWNENNKEKKIARANFKSKILNKFNVCHNKNVHKSILCNSYYLINYKQTYVSIYYHLLYYWIISFYSLN